MSLVNIQPERVCVQHPAHPAIRWYLTREEAHQVAKELTAALTEETQAAGPTLKVGDRIRLSDYPDNPPGVTALNDGTGVLPLRVLDDKTGRWWMATARGDRVITGSHNVGWTWAEMQGQWAEFRYTVHAIRTPGVLKPGDQVTDVTVEPPGVTVVHDGSGSFPYWIKRPGGWYLGDNPDDLPDPRETRIPWGQMVANWYNPARGLKVVR